MFIIRFLFFLFFFFSLVAFAGNKKEIISEGFIAIEGKAFEDIKSYDLSKDTFKRFRIQLHVNTKRIKNKTYFVKVICPPESLVQSNIDVKKSLDSVFFTLDEQSPETLYFLFDYPVKQKLNFRMHILNEFEYNYIIENERTLYGIAYGIIFCAFLYNWVIFMYTKQRSFLYYSLMQLFILFILLDSVRLASMTHVNSFEIMLLDFLENTATIMTILFSKEILNTRKTIPWLNKMLTIMIIVNVLDLIVIVLDTTVLYAYVSRMFMVIPLLLAGSIAFFKGQRSAVFYLLGWGVIFVSLFFAQYELTPLSERLILHIGFPLESLILSFALGYKLKQTVEEKNEKEQLLIHQSKLASMGEMINNIAHQWRQPLTHLSFINMDIQMANEQNNLPKSYLNEKIDESYSQIEFMSETIESFKDFYQPNKSKQSFCLGSAVQKAINIILPSLQNSNIQLDFNVIKDYEVIAYENEYSQIVLNFLSNAKEIIQERNIVNSHIIVELDVKNNRSNLSVRDNAGGIKEEVISKIFDPYFSTKRKSSGIGLYMSKAIVESHFNGTIHAFNTSKGACFEVNV